MTSEGTSLDQMDGRVAGSRSQLFDLVVKTTGLTVLTLGVYSFWARTRVRRWLWSALRVGGTPFEYVGQPLEKLMGFVVAAVIVAVYLGLVTMVLIFASLNIWGSPGPGTAASFALLLPVYWFAQYRGMRYLLNHTRWRGISFSMAPGAWRYAGLAMLWTTLSILSLGLLWPVRTQRLWRFRAERSFYGDDHFRLGLRARNLFAPFLPAWVGAISCGLLAYAGLQDGGEGLLAILAFAVPATGIAWVHWRVASYERLVSSLGFAGAVSLAVRVRTGRVIGIHIGGWITVGIVLIILSIALTVGFGAALGSQLERLDAETLTSSDPWIFLVVGLLVYLTFFLGRGALRLVFVTYPLIKHIGSSLHLRGAAEVNAVRAGKTHHMADADGFANLFDLGSGI
ncbi:hypothetical protein JANAI62_02740 [Jannaschia pagri]|uniref:DUF898 domain-containing protein n=1 Tax=Jannaschia pagri TaxID=2829797 RepID=A0ABQ4NGU9_9RHOB|nr:MULTISPECIES: DUF898 family protein [unclassified Jannaschia]GIT90243.1 hypothetical protein JANAI61_07010 [Jannaschia sp. AI_61]GIT93651.1 hypothetical protein JANAI62_02740 [Jannaschia sp. AI_62]